jgi:hypothetical protein
MKSTLLSLFILAVSAKNEAWPKIVTSTEFELDIPKMYRYLPTTNILDEMVNMTGVIRVNGANNRVYINIHTPYPMSRSTDIYRLNDFKNKHMYERTTILGNYCDKYPIDFDMDFQAFLTNQLYSEQAGVTEYQGP